MINIHIHIYIHIFLIEYKKKIYIFSHIWSKMIAADLYSTFQNVSYENKESLKTLGNRYRESFLVVGGTYSARENFRKFSGRDPNPKALLKTLNLDIKSNMLETEISQKNKTMNNEM